MSETLAQSGKSGTIKDPYDQHLIEIMNITRWSKEHAAKQLCINAERFTQIQNAKGTVTDPEHTAITTLLREVRAGRFNPEIKEIPEVKTEKKNEQLTLTLVPPPPEVVEVVVETVPTGTVIRNPSRRRKVTRTDEYWETKAAVKAYLLSRDPNNPGPIEERVKALAKKTNSHEETVGRWAMCDQFVTSNKIPVVARALEELLAAEAPGSTTETRPVDVETMTAEVPSTPAQAAPVAAVKQTEKTMVEGPTTSAILNYVYSRMGDLDVSKGAVAMAVGIAFQKARHLGMSLETAEIDVTQ